MSIRQYIEQIAQGQYEAFHAYLNTGENGGPVTELHLRGIVKSIPNKTAFFKNLFRAIESIKTLTTLGLSNNNIGNKVTKTIAQALKTNTTLKTLCLNGNNIGDAGAAAIAQALKTNTKLTSLVLNWNSIASEGATAITEALKTNTSLTMLELSNNKLTQEAVTAILRRIPQESVISNFNFYILYDSAQKSINKIIGTLQTEKEVLDGVYRLWPQPITEAFAQHFTLITNETAPNLLIDPNNDISRGLAYVQRRKLTDDNEKSMIKQNKRGEQAQSRESAQETPLNAKLRARK